MQQYEVNFVSSSPILLYFQRFARWEQIGEGLREQRCRRGQSGWAGCAPHPRPRLARRCTQTPSRNLEVSNKLENEMKKLKTFLWVLVALKLCKEGSFAAERKRSELLQFLKRGCFAYLSETLQFIVISNYVRKFISKNMKTYIQVSKYLVWRTDGLCS